MRKIQQYLQLIPLFEEFSESMIYNLARRAKTETLKEG